MVSRRVIRCGGPGCRCSTNVRWHAKSEANKFGQGLGKTRRRSGGKPGRRFRFFPMASGSPGRLPATVFGLKARLLKQAQAEYSEPAELKIQVVVSIRSEKGWESRTINLILLNP